LALPDDPIDDLKIPQLLKNAEALTAKCFRPSPSDKALNINLAGFKEYIENARRNGGD
jgi:glucuronate isomerase